MLKTTPEQPLMKYKPFYYVKILFYPNFDIIPSKQAHFFTPEFKKLLIFFIADNLNNLILGVKIPINYLTPKTKLFKFTHIKNTRAVSGVKKHNVFVSMANYVKIGLNLYFDIIRAISHLIKGCF